jgi:hypothetical protein
MWMLVRCRAALLIVPRGLLPTKIYSRIMLPVVSSSLISPVVPNRVIQPVVSNNLILPVISLSIVSSKLIRLIVFSILKIC